MQSSKMKAKDGSTIELVDNRISDADITNWNGKLNVDGSNATPVGVTAMMRQVESGSADLYDDNYYFGDSNSDHTQIVRRPVLDLWNYIKGKISSVLKLTASDYAGKAATAGTADKAVADKSGNDIETTYATKSELDAKADADKVVATVANAINALDVSSVGGDGKYISAISETDGKISAAATTMDTTPTANSTKAVTSGGIKTALNNYVTITQENTSSFHIKNNEYYSFICRTQISRWERLQADFYCLSGDSSTVGKFNMFLTLSTSDTSLHTPERVAELGGVVWDYNYKGYNTIKYRIYVAKSGDNFYFYAKRNSSNGKSITAFRSCLLYTTKKDLTDNISADLDDATWQTLSLVEMKNVYSSTTQERLDSHKNDTTVHITAAEREAWNAKGIVIKEIGGENVICFE